MDKNFYVQAFNIDRQKECDLVGNEYLVKILKTKKTDRKNLTRITNLYSNERAQTLGDEKPAQNLN